MTHYEILGVSGAASIEEIRAAYNALIKTSHTDATSSGDTRLFSEQLREAFEVLSDPVRRAQYDHSLYGAPAVPPEPVFTQEEDSQEAYRREYILKKQRDKEEAEQWDVSQKQTIFRIMRWVNFAILGYAGLLMIDYFLPGKIYEEVGIMGWQERHGGGRRSRGAIYSYMQTDHFILNVPDELHVSYDYNATVKQPLFIKTTIVFKIPTTVHCTDKKTSMTYPVLDTPLSNGIVRPLILFIVTAIILLFRKFSYITFSNGFMPSLLLFFTASPLYFFF